MSDAVKRQKITATPVAQMIDRDLAMSDPELAAEVLAASSMDALAQAAALTGVSTDPLPAGAREPIGTQGRLEAPTEMANPDDVTGEKSKPIDTRLVDESVSPLTAKDALKEHIAAINADPDHPLHGVAHIERVPFGGRSARLSAPSRPGFHRHWFNETVGRIDRALRAGYKMVNGADGKPMRRVVGVMDNGNAMFGFYMEIPVEWYVADINRGRKSADELERTIRSGKLGAPQSAYTPKKSDRKTAELEFEEEASGDFRPRT